MNQSSKILFTSHESTLNWEIADINGDDFEWKEEHFLVSNEVRFSDINVSWCLVVKIKLS